MKYEWLLFDADGTLFDYDKAEGVALEKTCRTFGFGFEPGYREAYRSINQQLWLDFENGLISSTVLRTRRFELLFEEIGAGGDLREFSDRYLANLADGSELMEGAEQIVSALHQRYRLALITNGLKQVQRPRLERSALKDSFSAFIISEEVGAAKPDAAIFDAAFRQMGNPSRERVLIIGDSLTSDIQGGNNYGIDTCWFNPNHAPPALGVSLKYEIHRLSELIKLLEDAGTE
jgi:2-haloacid dehalogenase